MPQLDSPVFALHFANSVSGSVNGSYMEFGHIDPTNYVGQLAKVPIDNSQSRWTADNVTFSIRGQLMDEKASLVFGIL